MDMIQILKKLMKWFIIGFYTVFVSALFICGIVFGFITLIPDDASKPCYLGYYAHCSFTPYSTLILFAMALIGLFLLIKQFKCLKKQIKHFSQEN